MNGLPPLSGAILISNPRGPTAMALALENPKPSTLRRVAQFAQAHNISIEKALDAAGFSANLPLAKRGAKSASAAFKKFFYIGQKGMKGKIGSGKFGAAGSRGGAVSKSAVRKAEHAYEARFGNVKRVSMKKARITDMSPADALRHRLLTKAKVAYRKSHGGKLGKGWGKSAAFKKISGASDSQLRAMAKSAGVSGILTAQEKRKGTKAKQRAHAEKLRAAGKLWQTPKSGGSKSRAKSATGSAKAAGFGRGRGAGGRFVSAASVAADHEWHAAYARDNRSRDRKGRFARRNALALENGIALMNPLALQNALALENSALGMVQSYTLGYAAPLALGGALGAGLHGVLAALDTESKLIDGASKIPVVGEYVVRVIEVAPFTSQGLLAGAGFLALASFLPSGAPRSFALAAAGSVITFGAGLDTFNHALPYLQDKLAGSDDVSAVGSDLGALALENVSALGALALENVSALGDGFAWELGRLGASQGNLGAHDYEQASVADAYYAGHDFSEVEGSALINGRDAWLGTFGMPSRRQGGMTGQASHLAQQPGHQWGWLIQTVGYEGAAQICALRPQQRVAVILALKQAAMKAYQDRMLMEQAMAAQAAPVQPELVPAAGTGAMGAVGASGPGGASYLGDPNVFASA